jgi:hypothetical protein
MREVGVGRDGSMLYEVLIDGERGYGSWRISEAVLAAGTTRSDGVVL